MLPGLNWISSESIRRRSAVSSLLTEGFDFELSRGSPSAEVTVQQTAVEDELDQVLAAIENVRRHRSRGCC